MGTDKFSSEKLLEGKKLANVRRCNSRLSLFLCWCTHLHKSAFFENCNGPPCTRPSESKSHAPAPQVDHFKATILQTPTYTAVHNRMLKSSGHSVCERSLEELLGPGHR